VGDPERSRGAVDASPEDEMATYGLVQDMRAEVDVPKDGILSRTVHAGEGLTLTIFGFDAGQELTEHTSSRPAIIEILDGEAEVVLDGDAHRLAAGGWVAMPRGMTHAIRAISPMRMALTLM
jgi:quercetin dioxygenase-like cupin family protein